MKVKIIRSKRKTLSIQINPDLSVTVRAPLRARSSDIERILADREDWIRDNIEKMAVKRAEYEANRPKPLAADEIKSLYKEAAEYIPGRVEYFADILGVSYGRITIRKQKTRWGSCSSAGNLNFNCLLMLTPADVIDYVVIHELCHRLEMNHSRAFWQKVGRVCPNYKELRRWLKTNGNRIIER